MRIFQQFKSHGIFWRKYLYWAGRNCPVFLEPLAMVYFSLFFLLFAGKVRRHLLSVHRILFPNDHLITRWFRALRVYMSFSATLSDQARFREAQWPFDWEFEGDEHFESMAQRTDGTILLTAHMGNYDVGSALFASKLNRRITTVRAPEIDPSTHSFESGKNDDQVRVGYAGLDPTLSIDLIQELRSGGIVAIQGDRLLPGQAGCRAQFLSTTVHFPAGPFLLARATGLPITPIFISRVGLRRYRVITCPPIHVPKLSNQRDQDIQPATQLWANQLSKIVQPYWKQWYPFADFITDPHEI